MEAASPLQMMSIYAVESARMSSGVCMIFKSPGTARRPTTVSAAESRTVSWMPFATLIRTPSLSPAPKRWDVRIEKPEASPMANPSSKKETVLVAPTAARAPVPRKRPTITVSAILYNCWKMFPTKRGSVNRMISGKICPVVMSCCIVVPSKI